jgi:hypothetical protein
MFHVKHPAGVDAAQHRDVSRETSPFGEEFCRWTACEPSTAKIDGNALTTGLQPAYHGGPFDVSRETSGSASLIA